MLIRELVDTFQRWNARHRADKTVRFYASRLRRFVETFGAREASSLTSLELDEFLFAAGEGLSDTTKHHNAVGVTTLQNFAIREGLLEKAWTRRIEKPPIGRRERIPTDEEVKTLLAGASPEFRLIYRALSQSGARPGELCNLQIEQILWDRGRIELKHHKTARKTGKPRRIPLGEAFAKTLREAIGDRPAGPAFLGPNGAAWTVDNLSSTHRRLRDAAGLDKRIVLYCARHRFGTGLVKAGVDLKIVAELMGHEHVSTTEIYTHLDAGELAKDQDKLPEIPLPDDPPAEPPTGPPV